MTPKKNRRLARSGGIAEDIDLWNSKLALLDQDHRMNRETMSNPKSAMADLSGANM